MRIEFYLLNTIAQAVNVVCFNLNVVLIHVN